MAGGLGDERVLDWSFRVHGGVLAQHARGHLLLRRLHRVESASFSTRLGPKYYEGASNQYEVGLTLPLINQKPCPVTVRNAELEKTFGSRTESDGDNKPKQKTMKLTEKNRPEAKVKSKIAFSDLLQWRAQHRSMSTRMPSRAHSFDRWMQLDATSDVLQFCLSWTR